MGEFLAIIFYPLLLTGVILGIWGIVKKSLKLLLVGILVTFTCAMLAMFSIGTYLMVIPAIFLLFAILFFFTGNK